MNPIIKYTDWGLASTIVSSDGKIQIQLNQNLRKYPDLHTHYLLHELHHTHSKGFGKPRITITDFILDCGRDFNPFIFFKTIPFIIRYPKSSIEFLPFRINDGRVGFVPLLVIIYLLLLAKFLLIL